MDREHREIFRLAIALGWGGKLTEAVAPIAAHVPAAARSSCVHELSVLALPIAGWNLKPPPSPGRRNHPETSWSSGPLQSPGRWNHLEAGLELGVASVAQGRDHSRPSAATTFAVDLAGTSAEGR